MADIPLINGRRYSYASIEVSILRPDGSSEIFIDIDSLNYSEALDIAFARGTARGPIGWTAGTYEAADTTMSMGKSSFQTGIVDNIGDGWLGSNLQITAKYSDDGEPLTTDVITCRIAGAADDYSDGPDDLKTEVTCKTFGITRNGIKPIADTI
jgi:hypothetical protein